MAYEQIQNSLLREQEKRRMLQREMLKGSQYNPNVQVSGRSIPYSPIQGLTELGKAWLQKRAMDKSDKRTTDLNAQAEQGRQDAYGQFTGQYFGQDKQPLVNTQGAEMAGPQVAKNEAYEADPVKAAMFAMQDPYLRGTGLGAATMPKDSASVKDLGVRPKALGKDEQGKDVYRDWFYQKHTGEEVKPYGERYSKASTASETNLGSSKFADEFAKMQVGTFDEKQKEAQGSYEGKLAMERFMKGSNMASQGAAQPLLSFAKNIFASAGVPSESLVSEQLMSQALNERQAQYMKELGARGLTDTDMKILRISLPQINTSVKAREEIARVLMKSYDGKIEEFSDRYAKTLENNPEVRRYAYKPLWLSDWESDRASAKEIEDVNKLIEEGSIGNGAQFGKIQATTVQE